MVKISQTQSAEFYVYKDVVNRDNLAFGTSVARLSGRAKFPCIRGYVHSAKTYVTCQAPKPVNERQASQ
jgi:hypothetical protein